MQTLKNIHQQVRLIYRNMNVKMTDTSVHQNFILDQLSIPVGFKSYKLIYYHV